MTPLLYDYWLWWREQMASLVPAGLRDGRADEDVLLIEPSSPAGDMPFQVSLGVYHHRRLRPLGRFRLDGRGEADMRAAIASVGRPRATQLALPPGAVMEKRLALPLAAESELANVLAFAMDRETPFAAEDVWWTFHVEARDRAAARLSVRLSLVPKEPLAALLSHLDRAGLPPTALLDAGDARVIPLSGGGKPSWRDRLVPAAATLCLALAVAVAATPFLRQSLALAAVDRLITGLKPDVDAADALRRRIEGRGTGRDILADEALRLGDPLKVLAAVTRTLPDDTYLSEFSMRQRQVGLVGQSADASRLIGALAADPAFRDPAFSAPVTRGKDGGRDLFSIKVEARP